MLKVAVGDWVKVECGRHAGRVAVVVVVHGRASCDVSFADPFGGREFYKLADLARVDRPQ